MEGQQVYHIPALAEEAVGALNVRQDSVVVDATFGGGGHSRIILSRMGEGGRLFGFDQDMDAYANRIDDSRFTFVHGNFRYLSNFLRYYGVDRVDGILADLGVSSHHFDDGERGFSFRYGDSLLDMRMNRDGGVDARKILADRSAEELTDIFRLYGELKNARKIADAVVKARAAKEIAAISDFLSVVRPLANPRQEKKELAQMFQALRMEVNREVDALGEFLRQAVGVLRPGGRLAVITYHSIEDRMVKNFMRSGRVDGKRETDFFGKVLSPMRPIWNKAVVPGEEEVARNPRARSAKLRAAEKTEE